MKVKGFVVSRKAMRAAKRQARFIRWTLEGVQGEIAALCRKNAPVMGVVLSDFGRDYVTAPLPLRGN